MPADHFMGMYSYKAKLSQMFIVALKWIAAAEMTLKFIKAKDFLLFMLVTGAYHDFERDRNISVRCFVYS